MNTFSWRCAHSPQQEYIMKKQVMAAIFATLAFAGAGSSFARGPASTVSIAPLSNVEIQDLTFMREEEKVARDVYLILYEQWGLTPFSNISSSEQMHMDAMLKLLRKYGLPDPAENLAIGEFANTDLQALHDTLLTYGLQSDTDALLVGGTIEETDILDLIETMARTDNADLDKTYSRLLCGSNNHLRAFARIYTAISGQPYPAQTMPQSQVDAILSAPHERCGR
jgi:hypothetical protein